MKIIPAPRKPGNEGETSEIVANPNRLARKALVMDSDYDRAATPAISRAERAVEQVRRQHRAQMPITLDRISEYHAAWRTRPESSQRRERLLRAAHDLRGCAADLDQPLVGRIAGSLSRLIGFVANPPAALVDAHIAALRAAGRPDSAADDPVAQAVAQELEGKVAQAIAREPG